MKGELGDARLLRYKASGFSGIGKGHSLPSDLLEQGHEHDIANAWSDTDPSWIQVKVNDPTDHSSHGEEGHRAAECTTKKDVSALEVKNETLPTQVTERQARGLVQEKYWDDVDWHDGQGLIFGNTPDSVEAERILFDSGCGSSVCPKRYAADVAEIELSPMNMRTVTNENAPTKKSVVVDYDTSAAQDVSVNYRLADVSYPIISAGSVTDGERWAILGPHGGWITRVLPVRPEHSTDIIKDSGCFWIDLKRKEKEERRPLAASTVKFVEQRAEPGAEDAGAGEPDGGYEKAIDIAGDPQWPPPVLAPEPGPTAVEDHQLREEGETEATEARIKKDPGMPTQRDRGEHQAALGDRHPLAKTEADGVPRVIADYGFSGIEIDEDLPSTLLNLTDKRTGCM